MKLTKNRLIKVTEDELLKMGYSFIKDTITGSEGLYIKVVKESFFLSLGFTISRFYESRFTGSFYVSKNTRWGSVWGDMPKNCYRRIGNFLLVKERHQYLDEDYNREGVIDAWWRATDEGIEKFIATVKLAENRFLGQENLLIEIESSSEIAELASFSSAVLKLIADFDEEKQDYKFIPRQSIDDIPIRWFKAAEMVLNKMNAILNVNTVKHLAGDAWRQWKLKNRSTI